MSKERDARTEKNQPEPRVPVVTENDLLNIRRKALALAAEVGKLLGVSSCDECGKRKAH